LRCSSRAELTALAFTLVLISAATHALWNFLVKRSGAAGPVFIWLFTLPSVAVLAPIAIWMIAANQVSFSPQAALFLAGSAAIHTVYFILLARGYREGDLSVVYPIARGTGPLLAGAIAIVALREYPSIGAVVGAFCIAGGAMMLARDQRAEEKSRGASRVRSVEYGLAIGVLIGIYTVWDKWLVAGLSVSPVILEWVVSGSIAVLVSPSALSNLPLVKETWRAHKKVAVAGALLSSFSYICFLTALAVSPVSRAAPLRETSILIGAILGTRVLAEGKTRRRLAAAAAISAGVILVSIG
jgi:drug/metabolite transporter (DMT)-like permease